MSSVADTPFHKDSDRGMSLPVWQDWIVDLLIKKHDEGLSDNQLRSIFAAEYDRRYGTWSKEEKRKIDASR